jgi:putative SOS response-associated peptidase YedK
MCGRFALDRELDQLIGEFVVDQHHFPSWAPRWNIAPTATIPIVTSHQDSDGPVRTLGPARWSLTPSWSPTLELSYPTFNARSESVAEKRTFRDAVAHHRALIPATAYYEWHTEGTTKTPYAIRPADDGSLAFAGLYSVWTEQTTTTVTTTLLTADATEPLAWLHPRRPLALPRSFWSTWLDPETTGDTTLVAAAVDASRAHMSSLGAYPVNPLRGDGPELLEPRD